MTTDGLEAEASARRETRWVSRSLAFLVFGLVVYAAGVVMYALSYHLLFREGVDTLGFGTWADIYEWSNWVQNAGIILVILGVVLYVAGKRKGA